MKCLILTFLSFILLSCASSKRARTLQESNFDGLRYESLNRYDFKRLEESKHSQKAIARCHKRQYNDAYILFKKQLDQQKENPVYWNHLATCYLLEEKPTRAKFYFDIALGLAPKKSKIKAIIMNNLGLYYIKMNRPYMAEDAFNESIKISNKFKTPKYNIAQVYLKFSQFKKASKVLTELYKNAPTDIDFLHGLGHLNLMQGKYKEANKYFRKIPNKYLTRDDIATNYALSLFFSGNSDMAYNIVKNAQMSNSTYLFAQTELIKKIERQNQ